MAVAFDAVAHNSTASATSIPNFTLTIGAGVTNGAVVIGMDFTNTNPTGISVTVGGVSASLVASTTATNSYQSLIYGLATGSATGSKTVSISWTNAAEAAAGAISFSGVDQTTPCNNGTSHTSTSGGSGGTDAVTITSNNGDLTFDWNANSGPTAPTAGGGITSKFSFNSAGFNVWSAGAIGPGTGTTTHTWTFGNFQNIVHSGVNLKAAAGGATQGLFQTPPLTGVGIGGPFFRDPLQSSMVRRDRIFVPSWMMA